jgi:nucleoside 2-deoxyribosyltransferase
MTRHVGALYAVLGAEVQQGVELAGHQVDLIVREPGQGREAKPTAVEVKTYSSPLPTQAIESFAGIVGVLRNQDLIQKAVIVSTSGFTPEAKLSGQKASIDLVALSELTERARGQMNQFASAMKALEQREQSSRLQIGPKKVFVVMPFAKEFVDVYAYGIRKVAQDLGYVADRADDIEHNDEIMKVVLERIREADTIVADITGRNPNVFYEVGYAHARERPVILVCRKGEDVPFDVRSHNYIAYETITELEERLAARLKATLGSMQKSPGFL